MQYPKRSDLMTTETPDAEKETRSFKARKRNGEVHNSLTEHMMQRYEFEIAGMACEHCVVAVEQALDRVDGIDRFSVRVGAAEVRATRWTAESSIRSAIENEGYRVIN